IGLNLIEFLSKDTVQLLKTPVIANQHYELVF
ncbi:MAG: hypothetical protein RL065_166, partial [Bacteroidota bacterium]